MRSASKWQRVAALLAVLAACSLHVAPAAAQACPPHTCCATNPTTGTPACGAAAGNPLNVMSGNKFQREEDMPALPGVLGLELVRYYNSEAAIAGERGALGRGWRLSYDAELAVEGNKLTVIQGDGTQTRYYRALLDPQPGVVLYTNSQPAQGSVQARRVAGSMEYTLKLASGNVQTFDAQGRLVRIEAPTGEYVTLQRDADGFLLRVTDPQGRSLSLQYLPKKDAQAGDRFRGVQHIDSPVGVFDYGYGGTPARGQKAADVIANLTKVTLPGAIDRIYHYENLQRPMLLTGITVKGAGSDGRAMNERIVTWGYDARGRANLSVKGSFDPRIAGPEQVTLQFNSNPMDGSGITTLTNSLGQTTRYSYVHINGRPQLTEVRGAGCSACGPVNVQYRYDARGRRVAKWVRGADGQQTVTLGLYEDTRLIEEADAQGRGTYAYAYVGYRAVAQLALQDRGWVQAVKAKLFGVSANALHTDRAGQVTSMTQGGQVVWRQRERTGTEFARQPEVRTHQPLRYVGQYHDEDSGLDYHGARYYEAGIGRFISPDPQGVADAVNEVGPGRLLDLYAYAGGQPESYFDPDGAARIRYFAITAGANGAPLGTTQGFTKARWAFIVDHIQAPISTSGDSALNALQQRYAANGEGLLYDATGDFLSAGQSTATWTGGDGGIPNLFSEHYGNNLISIPQFTVAMSDADATQLIASYISADWATLSRSSCAARALLLPQITFAAGDPPIDVTSAASGDATKQRILACGTHSDTDGELRRVAKYEAAAEINETGQINRDCSRDGCPGIGYYCDSTQCYSPRDQLRYGPPNIKVTVYTPSYGRSQFIGSTLVGQLLAAYDTFSSDELTQLGLTPDRKTTLQAAKKRGDNMLVWYNSMHAGATYADANNAWAHLSAAGQAKFTAETGLREDAFVNMARMKTSPPYNSNGVSLAGDAKQAFVTAAIMSDAGTKNFLMSIFETFDTFTLMSHSLMKHNLQNAKKYQPTANEAYLAAMVARAHNGGDWKRTYAQLTTSDQNDYVKNFVGTSGYKVKGDWNSLRCTTTFGLNTVVPGTNGLGIGGLQVKPLTIQ